MADIVKNNTEFSPPIWLDSAFLENALRSGESDPNIVVISSEIKRATSAGDNYASDMYRATIQITMGYQRKERSIIIKVAKDSTKGDMDKMLGESGVFQREISVYIIILPAMYRLLKGVQEEYFQPFAAKYLYSHQTSAIIFEDLKKQGFILAESKLGLDIKHCLLVLRTIARFHAASVVLHQINSESLNPFLVGPFSNKKGGNFRPFVKNLVKNMGKIVNSWPEYDGQLTDNFSKLFETGMQEWKSAAELDESSFNVLTHGDLWMNNMMFRYSDDTGEVMDIRFVDFQMSRWSSPAIDLLYFLSSSASPDVLEEFDSLIEEYYNVLCETLVILGYKEHHPSLKELTEDIDKRGIIAPMTSFLIRTVALRDPNKVPDFNKLVTSEEGLNLSETYLTTMKKFIPFFVKRGWI